MKKFTYIKITKFLTLTSIKGHLSYLGGGLGGLKRFLGESRGFFGSESVGFFSKCLILVHLTLLRGPVSQILTLTIYHNTLSQVTRLVQLK